MLILFHSILRLTFYKNGAPPGRRDAALLCSDAVCFYLGDLLPLDHEPLIDHLVDVIVSAEPPAEPAPLPHRFQEVRQPLALSFSKSKHSEFLSHVMSHNMRQKGKRI